MAATGQWINDYLGPLSVVIGILTIIPVLITAWHVTLGEKRKRMKWFTDVSSDPGQKPSILIIDLFEKSEIKPSVMQYTKRKSIQVEQNRIFEVNKGAWLKPEDMPALAKEIHDAVADVIRSGTDVVHVFYAGPVMPSMFVGLQLATCRAILYQWDKTQSTFVNWGPLHYL